MVNTSLRKITNHKPDWLKIKLSITDNFKQVNNLLNDLDLNTVCVEARCPNIYECWDAKTATIIHEKTVNTKASLILITFF